VSKLTGHEAEYGAYYLKVVTKATDKGDTFIKTVRRLMSKPTVCGVRGRQRVWRKGEGREAGGG
jgi:hypothetical protein